MAFLQEIVRSASDDDRTRRFYRFATRRIDRASVAGCRFREPHPASPQISGVNGGRCAENRGVSQRRSTRRANRRVSLETEAALSVSSSRRLGVRLSTHEGQATILAWDAVAILREAGSETGWNDEARVVSHVPAHVWNSLECEWRESKSRARAAATREPQGHDRCLHASCWASKARREAQSNLVRLVRKGLDSEAKSS